MGVEEPKPIELVRPIREARHEMRFFLAVGAAAGLLVAWAGNLWTDLVKQMMGDRAWVQFLLLAAVVLLVIAGGYLLLARFTRWRFQHRCRFLLVIPVLSKSNGVWVRPLEGYGVSGLAARCFLARFSDAERERLARPFQPREGKKPAWPFQGEPAAVFADLAAFVLLKLLHDAGHYLLKSGEYHGYHYEMKTAAVEPGGGLAGNIFYADAPFQVVLPEGARLFGTRPAADPHLSDGPRISIEAAGLALLFRISPRWALLGPRYHGISFEMMQRGIRLAAAEHRPEGVGRDDGADWPLEIAIDLEVRPARDLLAAASEAQLQWVEDLVEYLSERLDWMFYFRQDTARRVRRIEAELQRLAKGGAAAGGAT